MVVRCERVMAHEAVGVVLCLYFVGVRGGWVWAAAVVKALAELSREGGHLSHLAAQRTRLTQVNTRVQGNKHIFKKVNEPNSETGSAANLYRLKLCRRAWNQRNMPEYMRYFV